MILYKDKECTTEAICPMCFCQPIDSGQDYFCTNECAWCGVCNDLTYFCSICANTPYLYSMKDEDK